MEAVEAVWTNEGRRLKTEGRAPAVLGGLGSLRSKSLLRVERAGDAMRFVMLEMIREYASEQLVESGEDREARRAHAFYYLGLAEEMEGHANGPEGSEQLARIEREYANARAALQWLLQEGDVAHAARLAAALGIFWRYHGHWTEGMGWLEAILLRSDDAPAKLRPRLLRHAGVLSTFQGEYIRADDYFDKAITLARQLEAWVSLAETLESRAMLAVLRDEYSYAEVYLRECLALYRELGDEHGVAMALNGLGHHAYAVGDNHKAEEMLTEALSLFEALGDT